MTEIGDLDALLADLQLASAELETQIKHSPRGNNINTVNQDLSSLPSSKIFPSHPVSNYISNTVRKNHNQKPNLPPHCTTQFAADNNQTTTPSQLNHELHKVLTSKIHDTSPTTSVNHPLFTLNKPKSPKKPNSLLSLPQTTDETSASTSSPQSSPNGNAQKSFLTPNLMHSQSLPSQPISSIVKNGDKNTVNFSSPPRSTSNVQPSSPKSAGLKGSKPPPISPKPSLPRKVKPLVKPQVKHITKPQSPSASSKVAQIQSEIQLRNQIQSKFQDKTQVQPQIQTQIKSHIQPSPQPQTQSKPEVQPQVQFQQKPQVSPNKLSNQQRNISGNSHSSYSSSNPENFTNSKNNASPSRIFAEKICSDFLNAAAQTPILEGVSVSSTDDLVGDPGNPRNQDFSAMNNSRQLNVCTSPAISGSSSSHQLNNGCFQTKLSSPALSSSSANHAQQNNYQQTYQHQQIKSSSFTQNLNIPGNRNSMVCSTSSSAKTDSSTNYKQNILKNSNNQLDQPTQPSGISSNHAQQRQQLNSQSISNSTPILSNITKPVPPTPAQKQASNQAQYPAQNQAQNQAQKPSSNPTPKTPSKLPANQPSSLPSSQIMKLCIVIGKKHHIDLQIFHDETSRDILDLISAQKSLEPKSTQVIYEELPKLQMLRIFEDHESIYEAAKVWLTNSKNTLRYAFKENKYRFINCPEDYLIPKNVVNAQTSVNSLRVKLINDFFPMNGEKGKPLEFSSILYVKEKSRKKWVKKLVLIKAEGVFVAKSDYKKALSEKNPAYTRAAHISDCHMYYGYGWSKKLKAPTDFGFALKNPIIQTKNKNISYFCCETEELFNRWVAVVRTVKYGSILRHNFKYVSNESGKDRIFQIKEGHDRRLHPEKFKGKLGVSSQNSTQNSQNPQNSQNTGNFASNQANTPGNHGNAMLQRHQHSQNYDSMNSTQTRQTHLSGTSTDFSQSNQSNQSQAYLAGQAYARRLQSQQNQQFAAPMTQFYEQGQSRNVGAVNDFPPPPPFVHQLENVFQNAKENSGQVNRMNHPSSGSRNSYNSDMSQGQIGLNSNGSNGSGLGHGSPHGMNQNQQFSQNSHQFSQNSTKQTNINLNITNQPVFNLNSTLTRKASANLNKFDHDDTFDSEEDDFEHKLDAMGTLESSVFNPGTVLRQTSYRSENNKIPTEDFQSELARKLGGASATLQRSNTNGAVGGVRNSRNGEVFPPPPPFELPPVPQNFTNKPPPPPRRR